MTVTAAAGSQAAGAAQTVAPAKSKREAAGRHRSSGRRRLVVAAVVVAGCVWGGMRWRAAQGGSGATAEMTKVARTTLRLSVAAQGDLESSRGFSVSSEVEGQTTILFLAPEGTRVKKGDLVCELDSGTLRSSLVEQQIATRQARSTYESAVKSREVAEFAVKEYQKGTFPQEMQAAQHAEGTARSNLEQAISKLAWSTRMFEKRLVPLSHKLSDQYAKQNCELALESARARIRVLEQYTQKKSLAELEGARAKAVIDELAKQAAYELERSKEAKLERQIAHCRLTAPADGLVVYANEGSMGPGAQPKIEEGATVRERQKVFTLPDVNHMRVNAKVDEALMTRIGVGQKARVIIDAFPGEPLDATVAVIRPLADTARGPGNNSDVRIYTALVSIDNARPGLRPGMTAKVAILAGEIENAVTVPVHSVLQYHGKDHVYVSTPAGPVLREVMLGASDDKLVEVVRGVDDGELVALEPLALLTERERHDAFDVGTGDEQRARWDTAASAHRAEESDGATAAAEGMGGEDVGGG